MSIHTRIKWAFSTLEYVVACIINITNIIFNTQYVNRKFDLLEIQTQIRFALSVLGMASSAVAATLCLDPLLSRRTASAATCLAPRQRISWGNAYYVSFPKMENVSADICAEFYLLHFLVNLNMQYQFVRVTRSEDNRNSFKIWRTTTKHDITRQRIFRKINIQTSSFTPH